MSNELTFKERMAVARRGAKRLQVAGVLVYFNVVRGQLGTKLLGTVDALENYGIQS